MCSSPCPYRTDSLVTLETGTGAEETEEKQLLMTD